MISEESFKKYEKIEELSWNTEYHVEIIIMDILLASYDLYSNKRTSTRLKFFLNTDLRPVYITNISRRQQSYLDALHMTEFLIL